MIIRIHRTARYMVAHPRIWSGNLTTTHSIFDASRNVQFYTLRLYQILSRNSYGFDFILPRVILGVDLQFLYYRVFLASLLPYVFK